MARRDAGNSSLGPSPRVIVVGAGVAGAATAVRLCELGLPVTLISLAPARHAPSAALDDGVSAALDLAREGDSAARHLADCLAAARGQVRAAPLENLILAAPELLEQICRLGVGFERSAAGALLLRRASGSHCRRTAFAASPGARSMMSALDDQLNLFSAVQVLDQSGNVLPGERLLVRLEYWDLLDLVLDDQGAVIGVVAEDQRTGRVRAWPALGVCLATGGYAALWAGASSTSDADGAASVIAWRRGAVFANADLVQFEPTSVLAGERAWLVGELLRCAGARLWTPVVADDARRPADIPEADRDYLLEARAAEFGNLPPAEQATRVIVDVLAAQGGRRPESQLYLDASSVDRDWAHTWFERILRLGSRHFGHDPIAQPWRVVPAAHTSLGGLWVDYEADGAGRLVLGSPRNHATSLPGLYAVGEAAYQYHGACRLGGHALLEALYGARLAAQSIKSYREAASESGGGARRSLFEHAERQAEQSTQLRLGRRKGVEEPRALRRELGRLLAEHLGPVRTEAGTGDALSTIAALEARSARARVAEQSRVLNASLRQARNLDHCLLLGRLVAETARLPVAEPDGAGRERLMVLDATGEIRRVRQFDYLCAGTRVEISDRIDAGSGAEPTA